MTSIAEASPRRLRVSALDVPLPRPALLLAVAGLAWLAAGALVLSWPDVQELERTRLLGALALAFGTLQLAVSPPG
jgi:NitT/TauT family transport system permease protein